MAAKRMEKLKLSTRFKITGVRVELDSKKRAPYEASGKLRFFFEGGGREDRTKLDINGRGTTETDAIGNMLKMGMEASGIDGYGLFHPLRTRDVVAKIGRDLEKQLLGLDAQLPSKKVANRNLPKSLRSIAKTTDFGKKRTVTPSSRSGGNVVFTGTNQFDEPVTETILASKAAKRRSKRAPQKAAKR